MGGRCTDQPKILARQHSDVTLIPQNSYSRNFQNYRHNSENRYKSNGYGVYLYSKILTIPEPARLSVISFVAILNNLGATTHPIGRKDSP